MEMYGYKTEHHVETKSELTLCLPATHKISSVDFMKTCGCKNKSTLWIYLAFLHKSYEINPTIDLATDF